MHGFLKKIEPLKFQLKRRLCLISHTIFHFKRKRNFQIFCLKLLNLRFRFYRIWTSKCLSTNWITQNIYYYNYFLLIILNKNNQSPNLYALQDLTTFLYKWLYIDPALYLQRKYSNSARRTLFNIISSLV